MYVWGGKQKILLTVNKIYDGSNIYRIHKERRNVIMDSANKLNAFRKEFLTKIFLGTQQQQQNSKKI